MFARLDPHHTFLAKFAYFYVHVQVFAVQCNKGLNRAALALCCSAFCTFLHCVITYYIIFCSTLHRVAEKGKSGKVEEGEGHSRGEEGGGACNLHLLHWNR